MLHNSWRPAALGLLVLLITAPAASAAVGCTVDSTDSSGSIVCNGAVPNTTADGDNWAAALEPLASVSEATLEFNKVTFDQDSFQRMLGLVGALGSQQATGTVNVELTECSMKDAEIDLGAAASLPGSTQYVFTLSKTKLKGNKVNATALLAAQDNLDVTLRLLGSDVSDNTLLAAVGVAVGGTAKAAITLAENSRVANNKASLVVVLLAGGNADLSLQLASSNVTDNSLDMMGAIGVGGNATWTVTGLDDSASSVEGNSVGSSSVVLFEQEPLIGTIADILAGLTFGEAGFDLSSALTQAQAEVCSALAKVDLSNTSMPAQEVAVVGPALAKVADALCDGSKPAAAFSLASVAPALEGLLSGSKQDGASIVESLQAVLKGLLGDEAAGTLEKLVSALLNGTVSGDLGSSVDDLLAALLTSPAGDAAANAIADLLNQLGEWLQTPIGGGSNGGGGEGSGDGDGGSGGLDLGSVIADIIGGSGAGEAVGEAVGSITNIIDDLVSSLTGNGDGTTTPEDLLNQLISAVTGAAGSSNPLEGVNLSSLIPILRAVVQDPAAREQLPSLVQSLISGDGGGLDIGALSPFISAITGDPQAAAGLPDLLGLLGKLGLQM